MSKVAFYYNEATNPNGDSLPGVPLRDLTEEEFEALPKWLQQSVEGSKHYRKTKPPTAQKALVEKTEE